MSRIGILTYCHHWACKAVPSPWMLLLQSSACKSPYFHSGLCSNATSSQRFLDTLTDPWSNSFIEFITTSHLSSMYHGLSLLNPQEYKLKRARINLACLLQESQLQRWKLGHSRLSMNIVKGKTNKHVRKSFQNIQNPRAIMCVCSFWVIWKTMWEVCRLTYLQCSPLLQKASVRTTSKLVNWWWTFRKPVAPGWDKANLDGSVPLVL